MPHRECAGYTLQVCLLCELSRLASSYSNESTMQCMNVQLVSVFPFGFKLHRKYGKTYGYIHFPQLYTFQVYVLSFLLTFSQCSVLNILISHVKSYTWKSKGCFRIWKVSFQNAIYTFRKASSLMLSAWNKNKNRHAYIQNITLLWPKVLKQLKT